MGYALFANRKLMLTSLINGLQLQLDQLMNEKQALLDYSAAVADGEVTDQDKILGFSNYHGLCEFEQSIYDDYNNYVDFQGKTSANIVDDMVTNYINSGENIANNQDAIDAYRQYAIENIMRQFGIEHYKNVTAKEIAAQENEIEMRQKRIETKLTAYKQELQSVEQAEPQAIQNATPKFAGLG